MFEYHIRIETRASLLRGQKGCQQATKSLAEMKSWIISSHT